MNERITTASDWAQGNTTKSGVKRHMWSPHLTPWTRGSVAPALKGKYVHTHRHITKWMPAEELRGMNGAHFWGHFLYLRHLTSCKNVKWSVKTATDICSVLFSLCVQINRIRMSINLALSEERNSDSLLKLQRKARQLLLEYVVRSSLKLLGVLASVG